jgi:periplasmic protein TonB
MSITTNKLTRIGIMAAIVVTGAVACHSNDYKAQDEAPGADSGSRRVSTATSLPDSTAVGMGASVTPGAATAPGAPTTPGASKTPAATTSPRSAATVAKAKTAHGRASITMPKVYGKAETAPQFPGGQPALDKYITNNVNYPQQAIDDDMSGIVHVSFIIDEQGNVTKAKVLDRASVGDGLDQEALRVVRAMPSWKPGKVNGKKVRTRMELPISFQVES